ncbi:STAS/SEC14 domain-containing protein [Hymenobacter baengnokdamensis]|uniref:STAS/SEC14 domain-containing protein n=1 Tax=Hymenobacter baengnokdamensis TaxID=2615203 RepID=UPI001245A2F6|nr:STAS/SEC14 domain-containing protein [Hymenobacter baengnokdamensis]
MDNRAAMKKDLHNIFGKVSLSIEYDRANHLIYNDWQGYQTLESIILGANAYLDELVRYKCPYLLNDNTNLMGPWDHAVTWIAEDWTPRAIALGLTHFAHVVSSESFAALSAEAMFTSIGTSFQMRIFGSRTQARQWLRDAQQAAKVLG